MSEKPHRRHDPSLHADHGGGEHGGEEGWLVSYADMMTLLVGFFVILMSFSTVDQEKFEEAKKSVSKEFGGKYEKPNEDIANEVKEALKKAGVEGQVVVKANDLGVEISFMGTVFFITGSADIKPEAKGLMDQIAPTIHQKEKEFSIVIEGHTDDVPLSSGGIYKTNWELSSIRACRVLEYMIQEGFKSENMTAIGYGETRPTVPNRDKDGKEIVENQAKNRRVIIKLVKHQAQTI